MTTTYIGSGARITTTAAVAYTSGLIYMIGSVAAVALGDFAIGEEASLQLSGEHRVAFNADDTAVQGAPAFWDAENEELVDDDAGVHPCVGVFAESTTASYAKLLLNASPSSDAAPGVIEHAFADGATLALAAQNRDLMVVVDTQAGAVEVDLPTAASMKGRRITFVRAGTGTNAITIDQAGSEQINGSGTADTSLDAQHDTKTIQSTGTGWHVVASIVA